MALPVRGAGRESPVGSEGWMRSLTAGFAIHAPNPNDPSSVVSAMRFLLQMAVDLERHGNLLESIKCAESALLLRRATEAAVTPLLEPLFAEEMLPRSVVEEAEDLVLRCNTHAVSAFNEKRFDAAEFFLGKALFLTDLRDAEEVNYFSGSESRRLRLRAATLNNLGCMEKRRGKLEQSLAYLRQAVEIEVSLDTTSRGSPSTYLNLCTVLNELQRHHDAVAAAESAIATLEEQMLQQQREQLPGCAMMLVVGLYNLGVSLERRGRDGDNEKAHAAYRRSLEASRKFFVDPKCPTVELAMSAIRRMHAAPTFRADRIEAIGPRKALEGPADPRPPQRSAFPPAAAAPSLDSRSISLSSAHAAPTSLPAPLPQEQQQQQLQQSRVRRLSPLTAAESLSENWAQRTSSHPPRPSTDSRIVSTSFGSIAQTMPIVSHSRLSLLASHSPLHSAGDLPHGHTMPGTVQPPVRRTGSVSVTPCVETPDGGAANPLSVSPAVPLQEQEQRQASLPPSQQQQQQQQQPLPPPPLQQQQQERQQQLQQQASTAQQQQLLLRQPPPPPPPPLYTEAKQPVARPATLSPLRKPSDAISTLMKPSLVEVPKLSLTTPLGLLTQRNQSKSSTSPTSAVANPFGRRVFGSVSTSEPSGPVSSSMLRQRLTGSESMAMEKHLARTQMRQAKAEEAKKKGPMAGRRGSALAKAKEREQKRLAKEEAARDASMADALYENLVVGMRADELHRCHRAAMLLQRMWRGCIARTLLRRMVSAARKIQRVFRVFLVKLLAARRAEEERLARVKAAREKEETEAAIVLQARVRQFLHRLEIRRAYLGRKMRQYYAARRIQRGFRAFLRWREEHLAALMEAQRLEDERQLQLKINAARRIQWAYSRYLKRKEELKASKERERRERAAATIQAQVRGVLARAWFRYYKSYRREQELKSAANQKRIIMLQAAARVPLAVRLRRTKEVDLVRRLRQHQLNRAVTRIQCQWRSRVARIKLARLRAESDIRNRRATRIQRWYTTCVLRRRFLQILEAKRREHAAEKIQRWYRDRKVQTKEKEMARYYADIARRQRLAHIQAQSLLLLQAWGRGYISTLLVRSVRNSFLRLTLFAEAFQRIGRGYAGRLSLWRMKCREIREARMGVEQMRQASAACVIQRAWRCAMAKDTVEHMRRCVAASVMISKHYRSYVCRKELRRLREQKQLERETQAVLIIQRIVRQFLQRLEHVRLDKYYRERHQKKLVLMRREEAVTTLQAAWRGRATRQALQREREALEALAVYVVKIQRAWRARKFRRGINVEVAQRSTLRMDRSRAALTLQCFWRKMRAAEEVARLREANRIRREKAVVIQCWWRRILARWLVESLKVQREEVLKLRLYYMGKWDVMVTLINATLRVRSAQQLLLVRKRKQLLTQLTDCERERFLCRHGAATKIQAVYRGHYERVYARGIRRQKEEEERRRQEREALEKRSAIIIQCAYRQWRAIREANRRRAAKRAKALEEEIEHYTTVDPHDLVRQLFWVHETVLKRDLTKERLQRSNERLRAAVIVQKAVRQWLAKRRLENMRREAAEARAAKTIQSYWTQCRARKMQKESERQCQAAITIQARFRGYLVRREWKEWKSQMACERQHQVLKDDVYDEAATVLQSFWRRIVAGRMADRLRGQRQEKKVQQVLDEAATTIQRAYRHHLLYRVIQGS